MVFPRVTSHRESYSGIPLIARRHGLPAALLLMACGPQAGENYPGEPLLRMHGSALVLAQAGGQRVDPAICFLEDMEVQETGKPLDLEGLPQAVRDVAAIPPGVAHEGPLEMIWPHVYVVEVHSRGEFPAQFDVTVYDPPLEAAAIAAFSGEPPKAVGEVCAVVSDHPPVTRALDGFGFAGICSDAGCYGRSLLVAQDGQRSYARGYDCPPGHPSFDPDVCEEQMAGDPTLIYETYAEGVVGAARDPQLVYLAEPAPAGSYTAWEFGASAGLSAGYHVFEAASPDSLNARYACLGEVRAAATVEIAATYGDRIREALGPDATLEAFPDVARPAGDGWELLPVPDDVLDAGKRILAAHEMADCPMPNRIEIDPSQETISHRLRFDMRKACASGYAHGASGFAVLTASSASEDAQESDALGGAFFTHALVSGMLGAADIDNDGQVVLDEAYRYAYGATLRATSRTFAGARHPTFHYRLKGRGRLVLTRPGLSEAGQPTPLAADGIWVWMPTVRRTSSVSSIPMTPRSPWSSRSRFEPGSASASTSDRGRSRQALGRKAVPHVRRRVATRTKSDELTSKRPLDRASASS